MNLLTSMVQTDKFWEKETDREMLAPGDELVGVKSVDEKWERIN